MPKPQIKMGTAITNYHQVRFAPNVMLSSHATVCGNVTIGAGTSVFAGTQIRGDCEPIVIGSNTNIQENSCLHVSMGSKLTIGDSVTIGHNAVLHGCTIEDNVLIGMGAIVMDNAVIEDNCIVAAGAVVTQGTKTEPGGVYAGCPAKRIKDTDERLQKDLINRIVDNYAMYADWYR